QACRLAVEQGRFRMAWCSWLDPQTSRVTPVAWAGDGPDQAPRLVCSLDSAAEAESFIAAAMRLKEPVILDKMVALPLVIDAEAAGCLVLVVDESGFFNAGEMRLLAE